MPGPGLRVHQTGRRGIGILIELHAGQQKVEVIRDHQEILRPFQQFLFLYLQGFQLINRIKDLFLDPRCVVQLFFANDFANFLVHPGGPAVTISYGLAQFLLLPIKEDEIHTPTINPQRNRYFPLFLAFFQAGKDFGEQIAGIPA